jgi:hypothetical protein
MHHLATGNGDIDWQILEPRWRKGQRVVTKGGHYPCTSKPHPGPHCIRKTP